MKTILCLLLFLSPCYAGDVFSTKDNIKARGIDLSFTLPEGMQKWEDDTSDSSLARWAVKTQGMVVVIQLSMYKHHMHTNEEKTQVLKELNVMKPHQQLLGVTRKKVGNEPAVIVEHSYDWTNSEGRRVENQILELSLFPGDTTIKLTCQVSKHDYGGEPLKDSISAVRPMLLKMLNSVELH